MKTVFTDIISNAKPKKVVVDDYVESVYEILGGVDNSPKRRIDFTGSISAGLHSTSEPISHSFGRYNESRYGSVAVGMNAKPNQHHSFVISYSTIAQRSIHTRKAVTQDDSDVAFSKAIVADSPEQIFIPLEHGSCQLVKTRIVAVEPRMDAHWHSASFEHTLLVRAEDSTSILDTQSDYQSVNLQPEYNEKIEVSFDTGQNSLIVELLDGRSDQTTPLFWVVFYDATEVDYLTDIGEN